MDVIQKKTREPTPHECLDVGEIMETEGREEKKNQIDIMMEENSEKGMPYSKISTETLFPRLVTLLESRKEKQGGKRKRTLTPNAIEGAESQKGCSVTRSANQN